MAELVHSFLLPEVEKHTLRERGKGHRYTDSEVTPLLISVIFLPPPHTHTCSEAQSAQAPVGSTPLCVGGGREGDGGGGGKGDGGGGG